MTKKRSRNNPVFGELAHVAGDLWSRPTELRIFGTVWPVLLRVYLTREGTAPECQARAYADFVARSGDLMGEPKTRFSPITCRYVLNTAADWE
jgi:hypothetical protein